MTSLMVVKFPLIFQKFRQATVTAGLITSRHRARISLAEKQPAPRPMKFTAMPAQICVYPSGICKNLFPLFYNGNFCK